MPVVIEHRRYQPLGCCIEFEAVYGNTRYACQVSADDLTGNPIAGAIAAKRAFDARREEIAQAAVHVLRAAYDAGVIHQSGVSNTPIIIRISSPLP